MERAAASGADVSVVIPFYQAQATIGRALESVARQTRPVREVIVVDDASGPDAALALAHAIAAWPQLATRTVTLGTNSGAASARNAGWAVAQGTFVAFLDADDAWHPRKVELQSDYMQLHPGVAACGHGHCVADLPGPVHRNGVLLHDIATAAQLKCDDIGRLAVMLRNPFVTPSVMLRREVPLRFIAGQRHMEDHLLWMRMVLSGLQVRKLDLALVSLFKPEVGAGGLSADVGRMRAADLGNYLALSREGLLGPLQARAWMTWARVKHLRRRWLLHRSARSRGGRALGDGG